MTFIQYLLSYSLLIIASIALLTYWVTRKFVLKKVNRKIMKAEHNYQQQISNLQSQLYTKVNMLEGMVEKLQLSNQELNRLNEIRSKFMSIVAHDLRQPLSSIQGFTSVLMMDQQQSAANMGNTTGNSDQMALNNILKATDNMNQLMADLMDISMIESGRFKVDAQPFSLNTLLDDVIALQTVNAQKKGIFLYKHNYPEEVNVVADRFRLSQVINNLIGNAIKFTPQQGKIEVSFYTHEGKVTLKVSDTGPGIAHEEKEKIFQKFHQAGNDRNLKKQGWGLGLSIAQEIIVAHGGEIGVESAGLGQGSTFWFTIPQQVVVKN